MSDALPAPLAPQQPVCPERPRLRTLTIVESGQPVQYAAFCPWYEDLHFHGLPSGQRGAHCLRENSPYRCTGYVLDVQGTVPSAANAIPNAPRAQGRYLHQSLDQASAMLRRVVPRHTLGRRCSGDWGERKIGRAVVQIYCDHWTVAPKGLKRGEGLGFDRLGLLVVEGNGLIGLFSHLWGLPAGFVAVRFPEAVAYCTLDADARLTVAAAVDAWAALQAKRNAAR